MIIKKARKVILDSFIEKNGRPGFPEIIGRNRSTEWGGTISALHVLRDMKPTQQVEEAIGKSINGIIECQNKETYAWGAGDVDLIEATSEIAYYLSKDYPKYDGVEKSIDAAVTFIRSKYYEKGYFRSGAYSGQSEHTLYSTYQAVRALVQVNELSADEKKTIGNWIRDIRTTDGLWGENNDSDQSSIMHSIYALLTLLLLEEDPQSIKKEFRKQIRRIFKSIISNKTYFYYEEYSIPTSESDSSGKKFKRIRINHFILPFAIELFLKIRYSARARILVARLKKIRYDGAWGLYQSFRTTWATQQAVDAISGYQKCGRSKWDIIPSFFLLIWYRYWYTIIIIALLLIVFLLIWGSKNAATWCISTIIGVVTGTIANIITD